MANTTGKKFAGRTKGTPNKATQHLQELAEKLDVNPFEILLHFARGDYEALGMSQYQIVSYSKEGEPLEKLSIGPELRQKSAKDACEYLYPKLKQVEVSDPGRDNAVKETLEAFLKQS